MTPSTIDAPPEAVRAGNPHASGWVPQSPLSWLEALRDEHERLVTARRFAIKAATAVRDEQIALRAEYVDALQTAGRAGTEPPALSSQLDPEYQKAQLDVVGDAESEARAALDDCTARVARAVGAHRLGDEWTAATTLEDDVKANDPRVAVAARLTAFEAQWVWPPVHVPGPTLAELDAEVKAATEDIQQLTHEANARLAAWRAQVDAAHAAGESRPAPPDLEDESLTARSHAETRLQQALAARDKLTARGVIV